MAAIRTPAVIDFDGPGYPRSQSYVTAPGTPATSPGVNPIVTPRPDQLTNATGGGTSAYPVGG